MFFYKIKYSIDPRKILNYRSEKGKELIDDLLAGLDVKFSQSKIIRLESKLNEFSIVLCNPHIITKDIIINATSSLAEELQIGNIATNIETVEAESIVKSYQLTAADRDYLTGFVDENEVESEPEMKSLSSLFEKTSFDENKDDVFEKVKALVGMEPLKKWAGEMQAVKKLNVHSDIIEKSIFGMSYLVSVSSRNGRSTVFETMGEIVADVLGKVKTEVHEIDVEPDKEAKDDYNIDKIIKDISYIGEKNKKLHVFALNIEKFHNNKFMGAWIQLLSALKSNQRFLLIFTLPCLEQSTIADFHDKIDDIISNRVMMIKPFDTAEYCQFFKMYFEKLGISVDEEAVASFPEIIAGEQSDGRFYGIATINKVCDEILYEKLKKSALANGNLSRVSAEDIEDFLSLRNNMGYNGISGMDTLDSLSSLMEVKNRIKEIVATVKMQRKMGVNSKNTMHMMFSGAPGTGKTTVARILGRILKEENLLSSGGYYEVSRKDLVGMYVGHTAPKTAEICKMARGSVLFIDEAYTLAGGHENDFGKEAVGTLIAEMENYRDDFVVIFAGYDKELEKLFDLNPGLRDRIPYRVHFDNYNREELCEIFFKMLPEKFARTEGFDSAVKDFFENISDSFINGQNFSNARFVRNLIERVVSKASLRISMSGDAEVPLTLEDSDFRLASSDSEFKILNEKKKKNTIGF